MTGNPPSWRAVVHRTLLRLGYRVRSGIDRFGDPAREEWTAIRGDQTLRLNYDLAPDSIVVDVGGFEGQWASDIVAMYGCRIHVFEPVPQFAKRIARRFQRNPLVTVHECGLASRDEMVLASLSADSSSYMLSGRAEIRMQLRTAAKVVEDLADPQIDLMKINIEGAEYELLEHLIASAQISRIRDIQIQFHAFVPYANDRLRAVRQSLQRTHSPTYQYDFIWENWRRRDCSAPLSSAAQ